MNEFKKDLIRLKKITKGRIHSFKLLGGEPLLHPQISDFFYLIRKLYPNCWIILVTNGILLNSMKDEFWQSMHDNSVVLRHSLYPVDIDIDKYFEKAKKYAIKMIYSTPEELKKTLVESFVKFHIDLDGKVNPLQSYRACTGKVWSSALEDGRLYQCSFTAYVKYFNKKFGTSLIPSKDDYIDIYKAKNLRELLDFYEKPIPFCRYCGGIYGCEKWESSEKHDITEWTNNIKSV